MLKYEYKFSYPVMGIFARRAAAVHPMSGDMLQTHRRVEIRAANLYRAAKRYI